MKKRAVSKGQEEEVLLSVSALVLHVLDKTTSGNVSLPRG